MIIIIIIIIIIRCKLLHASSDEMFPFVYLT